MLFTNLCLVYSPLPSQALAFGLDAYNSLHSPFRLQTPSLQYPFLPKKIIIKYNLIKFNQFSYAPEKLDVFCSSLLLKNCPPIENALVPQSPVDNMCLKWHIFSFGSLLALHFPFNNLFCNMLQAWNAEMDVYYWMKWSRLKDKIVWVDTVCTDLKVKIKTQSHNFLKCICNSNMVLVFFSDFRL